MVGSGFCLAVIGVLVRYLLNGGVSPFIILFFQQWSSFLFLAPYLRKKGVWFPATSKFRIYMVRGLFGVTSFLLAIFSLKYLTLADATALSYTVPLFTAALATVFLKEVFTRHIAYAIAGGLLGMLIVVRPGMQEVALYGVLFMSGSALMKSIVGLIIKSITFTDDINKLMFYTTFCSSLWTIPFVIFFWQPLAGAQIALLITVGIVTIFFHYGFVGACYLAPLSRIIPFDFSTLIFVSVLAFICFGEPFDLWTAGGALVILASSIYALRMEKPGP